MNTLLNKFLTNPFVAYLRLNYHLIVLFIASVILGKNEFIFQHLGGIVYFPALTFGIILGYRTYRVVATNQTTGAYVDQLVDRIKVGIQKVEVIVSNYNQDFHAMESKHKVWITSIDRWVFIVASAIVLQHIFK